MIDTTAPRRAPVGALLLLLVTLVGGGCVEIDDNDDAVRVRAPTGLESALAMALQGYEGSLAGNPPRVVYGATGRHARAVTEADAATAILLTDHPAWADYVAERITLAGRQVLALDALVVVLAPNRTSGPAELAALTDPAFERIAVPSTESASAGMYAREALLRYGLWSSLAGRIDRADDAYQALERVMSSQADAAIVLAADARAADAVPGFGIDPAYHQPARIETLLLRDEPRNRALFDFLAGPQTTAIFESWGFDAPRPETPGPG